MNEKKPSERYAVPIGPFVDKSALLKMGYHDASSCLVMTPISLSEVWEREKANLRRGCRFRQKDLDPYFIVEEIEEARRRLAKDLQGWARAEKRKEYQKAYAPRRADIEQGLRAAPRRDQQGLRAPSRRDRQDSRPSPVGSAHQQSPGWRNDRRRRSRRASTWEHRSFSTTRGSKRGSLSRRARS